VGDKFSGHLDRLVGPEQPPRLRVKRENSDGPAVRHERGEFGLPTLGRVIGRGGEGKIHGAQQRLAFAGVLLAEPRYAMLDEATSALDAANEEHLYRALALTRTTPVSVSHRPGVVRFHADVLELPGDGSWRLLPADGYRLD
jgi:ABC-type thiamine transport system ATPase subunit